MENVIKILNKELERLGDELDNSRASYDALVGKTQRAEARVVELEARRIELESQLASAIGTNAELVEMLGAARLAWPPRTNRPKKVKK